MFKNIAIFMVRLYQLILRPLFPNACVFEPSCSAYAIGAIEKYGAFKGSYMGIKRILRCHPWQRQHYDPVP